MTRDEAVALVLSELDAAMEKFPTFPTDPIHAASIVAEEGGEVLKAANEYTYEGGAFIDMAKEAAHTTAMGLRFLMNFENLARRPSEQR